MHPATCSADRTHAAFLRLLPAIARHARTAFAAVRSPHDREDAVAEVVAHAWGRFLTAAPEGVTAESLAVVATAEVRVTLTRHR